MEIGKSIVPPKSTNIKKRRKIIPRDRKNFIRRRTKQRAKIQRSIHLSTTTNIQRELDEIKMKLIQSHKDQRAQEELQAIANIQTNSKFFHSYASSKLKSAPSIGPLVNPDGELESDPTKMAQLLNLQYEGVFSQPKDHMKVTNPHTFFNAPQVKKPHHLPTVEISVQEIIVAINKIAPNAAAAGPDGFHAQLLYKELQTPTTATSKTTMEYVITSRQDMCHKPSNVAQSLQYIKGVVRAWQKTIDQ